MDSRLLGRAGELAALTAAIDSANRGDGRIVLLHGEAGIGKTRLAAQGLAVARERGFTILRGQADPLRIGLAYAPIVEAMHPYLAGDESARILAELPDLGRLMAGPEVSAVSALADPELARTRLFEAVLRLVERLAARGPLLLFIDDLHWADRSTVELVHYIARGVAGLRVLVLTCYRTDEARGAIHELAAAVHRSRPDGELALRPLADPDVAELVRSLLGTEPTPELLAGVTARAKGVPLFITALVRHDATSSLRPGFVPTIVRAVVLDRLHRITERELRLLEIIAVAGKNGSHAVLRRVWRDGATEFGVALRGLIIGGLVDEHLSGPDLTLRAAHPLYAEVAYAELTVGERRALHAAIAEAIDELDRGNVLALAPHYRDAGELVDQTRAGDVMIAAGQRALGLYAADEAVRYFEAALHATKTTEPALALLNGLGHAYQGQGRLDAAAATWADALAGAQRHGDSDRRSTLRTQLALLESERGNVVLATEHAERNLQAAGSNDAPATLIRWVIAVRHHDRAQLRTLSERLLVVNDGDSSPVAQWVSHQARGFLAILDNDLSGALGFLTRALHYGELCAARYPAAAHSARRLLTGICALVGDIAGCVEYAAGQRSAEAVFQLPAAQCSAQLILATARYFAGDLAAAFTEVELGVANARRTGPRRLIGRMLAFRAFLLAERGESTEARACLAKARASYGEQEFGLAAGLDAAEAAIALHTGQPERVRKLAEPLPFRDPLISCLRVVFAGHAAVAAADFDTAQRLGEDLRTAGRTAPLVDALADRHEGLFAAARNEPEHARKLLYSAAERLAAMGAPLMSAQARLEWAELAGNTPEARAAVTHCLAVFARSGATPWQDRGRRLARSLGIRSGPTAHTEGALSKRETEVVCLVAEGLSNADVAARLFLSERTVETHLHNSYRRLGFTSRVALARWATENLRPATDSPREADT